MLLVAALAWPVLHHFRAGGGPSGAARGSASVPQRGSAPSTEGGAASTGAGSGSSSQDWISTPFGRVRRALTVPVPIRDAARLTSPVAGPAKPFDTSALKSKAAILIDATTGAVLAAKDADESLPPASLTKLMTLDLAFEDIEAGRHTPEDRFSVSEKAWKTGGSRMFIDPSMDVPLEDLLFGVAVDSGNDAAVAVAEGLAGSESAFVARMNAHARALGMTHTHFVNPNGLPAEGHVSSASDLAKLARHYLDAHPEALLFHGTREFTFGGITQWNQNPLLIHSYPGADGLKTGFASNCFNLVGTARRGDTRLLVVTLCAPTEAARYDDAQSLLDWGFSQFRTVVPVSAGRDLGALAVTSGRLGRVGVRASSPLAVTVPAGAAASEAAPRVAVDVPRSLRAPVAAGQVVGTVRVTLGDRVVASAPAVAAGDVARLGAVTGLRRSHPSIFWIALVVAAAVALAAALRLDRLRRRRRRLERLLRQVPRLRFGGPGGGGEE